MVGCSCGHLDGKRERATEVRGIVVRVFDVSLRTRGVMRLEVPVHDLGAHVVVVGRQVHVLWRQGGEAQDAQRAKACRHAPQNPVRHVAEYIGTRPARFTEEKFRKTSGDRAAHRR